MGWRLTDRAARASVERADIIVARFAATFDHLAAFPHTGRPSNVTSDITVFEKAVPREPYRIYYRLLAHGVEILRIYHTARRPPRRL